MTRSDGWPGRLGAGLARAADLVADSAVDLFLGGVCAGCGRPGRALCEACRGLLGRLRPFRAWPEPVPASLPPPIAVSAYDGVVRALVVAHKEHGRYRLADPLAAALARAVRAGLAAGPHGSGSPVGGAGPGGTWLCPMPSARARVRARGHDPLLRITVRCARLVRRSGHRVGVAPALRITRPLADQAGLGSAERWANLAGAFAVRPSWAARLAGRPVLLVDDVLTTGATLAEAARALAETGLPVLGCAVIAATRRRLQAGPGGP